MLFNGLALFIRDSIGSASASVSSFVLYRACLWLSAAFIPRIVEWPCVILDGWMFFLNLSGFASSSSSSSTVMLHSWDLNNTGKKKTTQFDEAARCWHNKQFSNRILNKGMGWAMGASRTIILIIIWIENCVIFAAAVMTVRNSLDVFLLLLCVLSVCLWCCSWRSLCFIWMQNVGGDFVAVYIFGMLKLINHSQASVISLNLFTKCVNLTQQQACIEQKKKKKKKK